MKAKIQTVPTTNQYQNVIIDLENGSTLWIFYRHEKMCGYPQTRPVDSLQGINLNDYREIDIEKAYVQAFQELERVTLELQPALEFLQPLLDPDVEQIKT